MDADEDVPLAKDSIGSSRSTNAGPLSKLYLMVFMSFLLLGCGGCLSGGHRLKRRGILSAAADLSCARYYYLVHHSIKR